MAQSKISDVFSEARSRISRSWIETNFSSEKSHWEGDEFKTKNPTRADASIGSFSINVSGKWIDFAVMGADGRWKSGDVFDLLEEIEGRPAVEIAREMIGSSVSIASKAPLTAIPISAPKPDWKPIPSGMMPKLIGEPSDVTIYPSKSGEPMFMVIRFEPEHEGGKKKIQVCYWGGGKFYWKLPPSLDYRPLYPFDRTRAVIVVEGEKKRKELEEYLGSAYSVTCWHGGAPVASITDTTPLAGCRVILWPDNDDVGRAAMATIGVKIRASAQSVNIVRISGDHEKGWDCGDAIREGYDVAGAIKAAVPWEPTEEEAASLNREPDVHPDERTFAKTDLGNAELFIFMCDGAVLYDVEKRCWAVWTGKRWSSDDISAVTPFYKKALASLDDGSAATAAFYAKSQSRSAIDAMLSLASREVGVSVHDTEFDDEMYLVNCPNGILDARTGELLEHNKESLCSKMTRVDYVPEAMCPRFQKFLYEIMCGDTETICFLQRWFGYSLTTDVSAQAFVVFFGTGANGKSTLVELIGKILDGYCKPAPPDTFVSNPTGGSKIPNDVAALRGMRLVLSTETEANAKLAESKIKSMTGGDTISARFMRGEFFEIKPTWKIVMSTNHRPRISGADNGIWRRIITVPFNFVATPDKMNCNLPKELWEEREGILAWMVRGAMAWYKDGGGRGGLHVSASIDEETQDYREDEDIVGRFLAQGCMDKDDADKLGVNLEKAKITATELHSCFVRWANANGEINSAKISPTALGRALLERGIRKQRSKHGNFYVGIYPKNESDRGEDHGNS